MHATLRVACSLAQFLCSLQLVTLASGSVVETLTHTVEKDSSITSVTSSGPGTVYYVYDHAGNLVDDNTYTYQYDAWNRLVKVIDKATSAFVLHYTYDGLGRLVRRQGPYPGYPNEKRVEHYYYDGSRRIQEVMTDPVSSSEEEVDSDSEPTFTYNIWTTREYVWSPHGTDVLLAQFEHITSASDFAQPWFGVHDHSGDLVGVVDADGTVREQRSYSPYGELLYTEAFPKASGGAAPATSAVIKLGHDGLFFDRFNANILTPPHAVGARGVYYNVNRSYSPHLGRFLQSDPNATGQMVALSRAASVQLPGLSLGPSQLFSDGLGLYAPYRGNPNCYYDPNGTFAVHLAISVAMQTTMRGAKWGAIMGAAFGGAAGGYTGGPRGFLRGMFAGALGGALGGAAGGMAVSAFSFSASGLAGTIAGGAADGAVGGFVDGMVATGDPRIATANAALGGALGAVLGPVGDELLPLFHSAGRQVLGQAFRKASGEATIDFTYEGLKHQVTAQWTREGDRLIVDPIVMYGSGTGDVPNQLGVGVLRAPKQELRAAGQDAGAREMIARFERLGSTGGRRGRQIEWQLLP